MNAPQLSVAQAPLTVERARPDDAAAFDAYVDQHRNGSLFHLSGWSRLVEQTYGYKDLSLIARRNGRIVGVLPLTDVRAPLLGRSLISTAFTVGGGAIADDDAVLAALAAEAARLGAARRSNYVELRGDMPLERDWLKKGGVYAGFELPLPQDENENLAMIPRKRRAELRKALKAADDGVLQLIRNATLDDFYKLYAVALRNHGTPVFSKRFLNALAATFSDKTDISIALCNGAPVAALLSFYYKDAVLPYYIGALPEAREARGAEFLYWSLMRRAAERGQTRFDFGRSKIGSGPYHFKKLWGAEPQPITYRCKLLGASSLPDVNPNNPKFVAFVALWRRMPVPLANWAGPLLAPNFP